MPFIKNYDMKKIKILVAQHKSSNVYSNDVYTPIHVGKALSDEDLCSLKDNTGDNISNLNPYFCELTAQYWAWKNMPDVEYIGLCHYRRYFMKEFSDYNIDKEMEDYDIILSKKYYLNQNLLSFLAEKLTPEDVDLFFLYMSQLCKNDISIFNKFYMHQNWLNPANMFVCRKQLFDEFCEWQFKILDDLFQIIPLSPYTRGKRLMGYFAETLLPFYAELKKLKIKEEPIVSMLGNDERVLSQSIKEICKNKLIFLLENYPYHISSDRLTGLTKDGLINKINNHFAQTENTHR